MPVNRRTMLQGFVAAIVSSPALARDIDLGEYWDVEEVSVSGNRRFRGRWTRTGSISFAMAVRDNVSGDIVRDTIEYAGIQDNMITLLRRSLGEYHGTVSADGRSIRGTATWYTPVDYWVARIQYGEPGSEELQAL
ncbi:hypothetical protein [Labrys sp. 22185]|uniref:hypothetical protein n=1 Tax=Labrys sp. 22185 TaxID=3453888 RepID=UPI003F843866